jgi:hypothetical protein
VKEVHFFDFCRALVQIAGRLSPGVAPVHAVTALVHRYFSDGGDAAAAAM